MKRILVGLDGSETSDKALRFAAELAAPAHAEIVAAYVSVPVAYPAELYPGMVDLEREAMNFGRTVLTRSLKDASKLGVEAKGEVLTGPPAETLADFADRLDADLLVVGSRGLGAVKRVVLGSTSERLVRISKRPVLVVH